MWAGVAVIKKKDKCDTGGTQFSGQFEVDNKEDEKQSSGKLAATQITEAETISRLRDLYLQSQHSRQIYKFWAGRQT